LKIVSKFKIPVSASQVTMAWPDIRLLLGRSGRFVEHGDNHAESQNARQNCHCPYILHVHSPPQRKGVRTT